MLVPKNIEYCISIMNGSGSPPVDKYQKSIKLARYDVSFVHNAMFFISNGQGLTSLQRNLAVKLTTKYRKQFKKMGINVIPTCENPVWETPIREVDRSKTIDIDEEHIYIRFPYDSERIKEINQKVRDGELIDEGTRSQWFADKKYWKFEKIETNFVKLYNWSKEHNIIVSDRMEKEYKQYENIFTNKSKYSIYATMEKEKLILKNAPNELKQYWNEKVASLSDLDKVKKCVDLAINLDNTVLTYYNYNSVQKEILTKRKVKLDCTLKQAVFNCFDLGFTKLAIGLSSHSPKNILEIKDIRKVFITKGFEPSQFVVNAKNTALNNVSDFHHANDITKIVITDRMSRLNNNTFEFKPDVMIGFGMYSDRNVYGANKVITLPPIESEEIPF
ncbi:MAG: hypothetical protein CBD31_01560 [Flavobacteriaceae bacterium TMED171]|nr:MAG: hypothetical protein CBD31_01560 [Flavobacteriaceae bacterium TMED171]